MHTDKIELRRAVRAARRGLAPEVRGREQADVLARLATLPELRDARSVMVYAAFRAEIDVSSLAARWLDEGRVVAVPRIVGHLLEPRRVRAWDALAPGVLGIGTSDDELVAEPDAIVVPGLAFDRACTRLGYGAGYYDRLLATLPGVPTVAPAFSCQLVAYVPRLPHDVPVGAVVTPTEVIRAG